MLTFIPVTEGCRNYMVQYMLEGSLLAQKLAQLIDFESGEVAVCPTMDISGMAAQNFHWGRKTSTSNSESLLIHELTSYLNYPNRFAVFEHRLARATDPMADSWKASFAVVGNEIY